MSTRTTWHFRLHDFHQEAGFFRKRHGMHLPDGTYKVFEAGREYTTQDSAFADKLRLERQNSKRNSQPVFEVFTGDEARERASRRALDARRGSADHPEAVDGTEQSGLSLVADLTARLAEQGAAAAAATQAAASAQARADAVDAANAALTARMAALESALGMPAPPPTPVEAPAPAPATVSEVEPPDAPPAMPAPEFFAEPEVENIDAPTPPKPAPAPQPHTPRRGRRE